MAVFSAYPNLYVTQLVGELSIDYWERKLHEVNIDDYILDASEDAVLIKLSPEYYAIFNLYYSEYINRGNNIIHYGFNRLPDGLMIPGNLVFGVTSWKSPLPEFGGIPNNLHIGCNLYIADTSINKIPISTVVRGDIFYSDKNINIVDLNPKFKNKLQKQF